MVRPRIRRLVREMPKVFYYKPFGIPLRELSVQVLSISEYESLKLKDYEKYSQIEASVMMKVSQPTFNRLYLEARKKLAKAIVEGLAIKIEGGNYKMPYYDGTGPMGQGPMTGRGLGPCAEEAGPRSRFGRGFGRGPGFRRRMSRGFEWHYSRPTGYARNAYSKDEEKELLKEELEDLKVQKEEIEKRLKEIDKKED